MQKIQIPTPALLINLDRMEENLACMSAHFQTVTASLRPHFKTHKSPVLALKQIEAGAIGMTCAKLGEAEILVDAEIPSILIANQIVDPAKVDRLGKLALKTELIVAADHPDNLYAYSKAAQAADGILHVLIEINVGLNRCGVEPGEAAVSLAKLARSLPGLHFAGVMGYEGHTVLIVDQAERERSTCKAMSLLTGTADMIRAEGIEIEIVSAGGTGTFDITARCPGITELQCGSYIFMDTAYNRLGLPFLSALSLLATVISVPNVGRAIIDAGMKTISVDNGLPEIISPSGTRLVALHEEHGILEVDPNRAHLHIGDRVEIIPSHVCTTVNLHEAYYAMRGDQVEAVWDIPARGKFQ